MAKKPPPLRPPPPVLCECRCCGSLCWCSYPECCGPCHELQAILGELARGQLSREERGSLHTLLKGLRDMIVARRRSRSRSPARSVDAPRAANRQQQAAASTALAAPASEAEPRTPPDRLLPAAAPQTPPALVTPEQ